MCTESETCEACNNLRQEHKDSLVKYWGVISGLAVLVITLVIFYAETSNATTQVKEHELRIRALEKIAVENQTLLSEIRSQNLRIEDKLDKHIDRMILPK